MLVPVLKCKGLDPNNPNNHRPIANVSFVSKIIENIVSFQPKSYLEAHDLLPAIQSGFRKGHSIETLLLRLLSDAIGHCQLTRLALCCQPDWPGRLPKFDHIFCLYA